MTALVLLDTVTIMRPVLSEEWAAFKQLGVPPSKSTSAKRSTVSAVIRGRTNSAFGTSGRRAVALLEAAGLETSERSDARSKLLGSRVHWDGYIQRLAPSMLYPVQDIGTARHGPSNRSHHS